MYKKILSLVAIVGIIGRLSCSAQNPGTTNFNKIESSAITICKRFIAISVSVNAVLLGVIVRGIVLKCQDNKTIKELIQERDSRHPNLTLKTFDSISIPKQSENTNSPFDSNKSHRTIATQMGGLNPNFTLKTFDPISIPKQSENTNSPFDSNKSHRTIATQVLSSVNSDLTDNGSESIAVTYPFNLPYQNITTLGEDISDDCGLNLFEHPEFFSEE